MLSENMSENEENVLEDFSGKTEVNGVMISPPSEKDEKIEAKEEESPNRDVVTQNQNTSENQIKSNNIGHQHLEKPKFLDILKGLGTTTLTIMAIIILFLLFMGYKYLVG